MTELSNRYDFVFFFDVQDGNPNGDPDAGNLPRIDPETGMGLVTDVCLKRKMRNYISMVHTDANGEPKDGYDIYVKENAVLNDQHARAYKALGIDSAKGTGSDVNNARKWMCKTFFDVRMFGAVMSTGVNCGQVRGPLQLTFARSVEPIVTSEHTITRMAATNAGGSQDGANRTMGRKFTVPYGLYRCSGFVSPFLAKQTGFSLEDLDIVWESLLRMFDHDRSASRGLMSARRLIIFKHANELGSTSASDLFSNVKCERATDPETPARSFDDYKIMYGTTETTRSKHIIELK